MFATGQDDYIHLDYWTARSQDQYTEGAVMVPFVGSHDVSRFASRADPGTADEWNQWVEQGLPGQPGTDDPYRASLQAHGWLLTTPGAPMIYMGDEYGEFGGADPDNRHMWRDNSTQNDRERGLLENISQLGLLRSELDSLRRGSYVSIHNSSDIVVFQRLIGEQSSLVALNRGATDASIDVGSLFVNHLTIFGDGGIENGTTMLNVTSHSVTILTNETATVEPEPEPEPIQGCTDSSADNYDPTAEVDDGTCTFSEPNPVQGCTDLNATNHDPLAEEDDGSCTYPAQPIEGCTDLNATNYNESAEFDDGSCEHPAHNRFKAMIPIQLIRTYKMGPIMRPTLRITLILLYVRLIFAGMAHQEIPQIALALKNQMEMVAPTEMLPQTYPLKQTLLILPMMMNLRQGCRRVEY